MPQSPRLHAPHAAGSAAAAPRSIPRWHNEVTDLPATVGESRRGKISVECLRPVQELANSHHRLPESVSLPQQNVQLQNGQTCGRAERHAHGYCARDENVVLRAHNRHARSGEHRRDTHLMNPSSHSAALRVWGARDAYVQCSIMAHGHATLVKSSDGQICNQ